MSYPLTIAGFDPTGGAGLIADCRVFKDRGLHPLSVITCITAQNSKGFKMVHTVDKEGVKQQFHSLKDEFNIGAVKLGLLHDPDLASGIGNALARKDFPLVVDPVLLPTASNEKVDPQLIDAYVKDILPVADIITPNIKEAEALSGIAITDDETLIEACRYLVDKGAKAVVIKGGHSEGKIAKDVLFFEDEVNVFEHERIDADLHGTGCVYSAHITASLCQGYGIVDSARHASNAVANAISRAFDMGSTYLLFDSSYHVNDQILNEVSLASMKIQNELPGAMVPEVGMNIAFAKEGASTKDDIGAMTGRIHRDGRVPRPLGHAAFGASRHIARIVLTALSYDSSKRSVCNCKYSDRIIDAAGSLGLSVSSFSRKEQEPDTSSMEWGTDFAIKAHGSVPDIIYDKGGDGKEPMVRIIGADPKDVLEKLFKLSGFLH